MASDKDQHPWEQLETLIGTAGADRVIAFLDALPPGEPVRVLSRLEEENQTRLLTTLRPEDAADLIAQLPDAQVVEMIRRLPPRSAAAIVDEMPSDQQADLLGDLDEELAHDVLAAMDPAEARDARVLGGYADNVAGGLMVTEYLAYPAGFTVADVVQDLRTNADAYRDYEVQYVYVIDASKELVGVLQLRGLLLADSGQPIGLLMHPSPLTVPDTASVDELRDFFDRHAFIGVPVLDARRRLIGVVRRSSVEEALAERSESDYRKAQGIVGGEELRTMPWWVRSRRRLGWLSVNIVLNIVAASIVAFYQDTLRAVIALAVFLPIISDMSGCSGNQAVAVSMRELALGMVHPRDVLRVLLKEISIGAINGVALGTLVAAVAWLWKGNPLLGLVVGAAMAVNTIVAVSIGGTVPLVLRRFNLDPALASGPILTTITDMCGFFLVLSFAAIMLPYLTTP